MMFYERIARTLLGSPRSRHKVRLLFGARQTGKTELLRRIVPPGTTMSVDLGAASVRRRFEVDPARFGREARALPRAVRHILIDEIQKVPALLDEVQSLYDERHSRFDIFLTGSSARKLRRHSANLLPGRSHVFRLYPVTLWEAEGPARMSWPGAEPSGALRGRSAGAKPFPAQTLERTLLLGNLPGIRTETREQAAATLAAYVENYLEEEIRREALVRDLGAFAEFLRLAALESGQQVHLSRLSQESGVPLASVKNYYQVLEDTFAGFWLRPYARRGRKRLLTTPRFLFFDTGARNAAAELPADRRILATEGPRLLEHWVGLELIYRAGYLGRGFSVGFWRAVSGAEVDFVWQSPQEDVPIEVKWTARPKPADARHVEKFLSEYPQRARRGLVICRCEEVERLTERVVAVPWNRF